MPFFPLSSHPKRWLTLKPVISHFSAFLKWDVICLLWACALNLETADLRKRKQGRKAKGLWSFMCQYKTKNYTLCQVVAFEKWSVGRIKVEGHQGNSTSDVEIWSKCLPPCFTNTGVGDNCSGIWAKKSIGWNCLEGKKKAFFNNELLDFFQQGLRSLQESRDFVIKWKDCEPVSLIAFYPVSLQHATCDSIKYW